MLLEKRPALLNRWCVGGERIVRAAPLATQHSASVRYHLAVFYMESETNGFFCELTSCDHVTSVRRYMSFLKFVSMLATRSVYFTRIDQFKDPYEGSLPFLCSSASPTVSGPEDEAKREYRRSLKENTKRVFASCWYASNDESPVMWDLYGGAEDAVCVETYPYYLRSALPDDVRMGLVKYIDYSWECFDLADALAPYKHKGRPFEHEREFRALIYKYGDMPTETGISRQVDLAILIKRVWLAPKSKAWFRETVEKVIESFGFEFDVSNSFLDQEPMF